MESLRHYNVTLGASDTRIQKIFNFGGIQLLSPSDIFILLSTRIFFWGEDSTSGSVRFRFALKIMEFTKFDF